MKRIYAAAALVFALFTGNTYAQQVDLESIVLADSNACIKPTGKPFSWRSALSGQAPTNDSLALGTFIAITGNGVGLAQGDQIFFIDPTGDISSQGASGWIITMNSDVDTNSLVYVDSRLSLSDSINVLLNVANFEADSTSWASLLVPRASLVAGQTYGMFMYVRPYPFTGAPYTDPDGTNNFHYIPVKWDNCTSSLKDLLNTKYASMDIYPNPTVESVSFEIKNEKATKATIVRVMDVTGKVVKTTNFGAASTGNQKYNLNVAELAAGQYSVQVITDFEIYQQKFIKK